MDASWDKEREMIEGQQLKRSGREEAGSDRVKVTWTRWAFTENHFRKIPDAKKVANIFRIFLEFSHTKTCFSDLVYWDAYLGCFSYSSFQSLSCAWLFATPWITPRQASLSITNSRSSLKLMSIKSVMPSSYLILFHPLLLCPNPSQHQSLQNIAVITLHAE